MSDENVEVVRQPITVEAHTRRRPEERLALRFPRAFALAARTLWGLPARSRLRQWLVSRFVRLGFEAANRPDRDASLILYHPDGESTFPAQFVSVGESATRGLEERRRFQGNWRAVWGDLKFAPEELITFGDRVVVLGRMKATGGLSGAPVENECAWVGTVSAGRMIREQVFLDNGEALKAAGLSE